ncbi:uncharacterized protein LOC125650210 [Ostrea edulis]|uniref:uncharacterized protein LOC125650210 n=1 Tax=Ostrea edulis TaxID=37623 RepID=UPI0024AE9D87|nr:uncharacterized protein LOC125650210 [Ostrea edulis]
MHFHSTFFVNKGLLEEIIVFTIVRMPKLLIKGANGIEMHIECDEATKECLISGDTDPQLKDMIVKMLIAQQCPEPTVSPALEGTFQRTPSATSSVDNSNPKSQATPQLKAPGSSSFTPPCPSPPVAPPPSSASCSSSSSDEISAASVHVWKDKQEDMLVHLRHERQDLFEKNPEIMELYGTKYQKICPTFFT